MVVAGLLLWLLLLGCWLLVVVVVARMTAESRHGCGYPTSGAIPHRGQPHNSTSLPLCGPGRWDGWDVKASAQDAAAASSPLLLQYTMRKCAYCRHCPPAEGDGVPTHRDIRRCPRAGAVCGTCGARSAKCVGGACKTQCTVCKQIGHRRADCTQPKPAVTCAACNGLGHRRDSQRCPKRSEAAVRTCTVCGSADHVKGVACEPLFQQWCKENAPADADARRLFEEAQSPKCAACGKPGHTAGTCSKPLPPAKVKKSSAEAVLRSAGKPTEGLTLKQLRESAAAVVEQQNAPARLAAERHERVRREDIDRLKAFHRRAEAGRCFSRNRRLAAWQRQHEKNRAQAVAPAASAGAAEEYRVAERKLITLRNELDGLMSEYNSFETRRGMDGSSAGASTSERERWLLPLIDQVELDIERCEWQMRRCSPHAPQQEESAPLSPLEDADLEQMFAETDVDGYVTLSARHYRKLLNGGAGRPADIGAQRLRYHTQRASNSLARGAEHWPGEEELDPRVLGAEVVPDRAPEFAGQFRLASAGTMQPRVIQPRDEAASLERHRERFKREQQRSDAARRDEEPCPKRLAASRARLGDETPDCEPQRPGRFVF
jgi:hypothetical protein